MRKRRFGVELEFSSNGAMNLGVGEALTNAGLGRWVGNRRHYEDLYNRRHSYSYYDGIGNDGSELELRSPILQGAAGFRELKGVVKVLNDLGCSVGRADGLHVHHDAPEFVDDKHLVLRLLKSWEQNQISIGLFIDPTRASRAISNAGPCAQITSQHIRSFESYMDHTGCTTANVISSSMPRGNLNLLALREHGSVEFRYHEGTLDWDEIESWIRFGQSFLDGVIKRKNPVAKAPTPVVLLNRLRASKKAKSVLTSKALRSYPPELVGV